MRFAEYLNENKRNHLFTTKSGETVSVDTTNVTRFIRLSVTNELLPFLNIGWPKLVKAGFIDSNLEIPPTIALVDMEIAFTLLETPFEKLHYIDKRMEFERNAQYFGDELDLLSFYLKTGFNIGDIPYDGTPLKLYGMNKELDQYFMREFTRETVKKPVLRKTKLWSDILARVENIKNPQWIEIGFLLLNISYEDQKLFSKNFQQVKNHVRKKYGRPNTLVLAFGPTHKRELLIGVAYRNIQKHERNAIINNAVYESTTQHSTNRALVIGINVEEPVYPYNILALMNRNKLD